MDPTRPTRVAEAIIQKYNSLQVKDEGWTVVAGIAAVDAGGRVHVLAVAFGLTALLAASTVAFTVIKVVGAAYLIYLGGRMLLAPPELDDAPAEEAETPAAKRPRPLKSLFMQGFLTNVLNPKVVLFFLSFFPQFVDPHAAHKALAFLALGAVLSLIHISEPTRPY